MGRRRGQALKSRAACCLRCGLLALALAAAGSPVHAAGAGPTAAQRRHADELLSRVVLIDGHNDLPWAIHIDVEALGDVDKYDLRGKVPGHTGIARLRAGRLGAQFWSVYTSR